MRGYHREISIAKKIIYKHRIKNIVNYMLLTGIIFTCAFILSKLNNLEAEYHKTHPVIKNDP